MYCEECLCICGCVFDFRVVVRGSFGVLVMGMCSLALLDMYTVRLYNLLFNWR